MSCDDQEEYPKPKSYLRIDFPEKEYYTISDSCCFIFNLPEYSYWELKFKNYPTCSKTIIFPKFKAEVVPLSSLPAACPFSIRITPSCLLYTSDAADE